MNASEMARVADRLKRAAAASKEKVEETVGNVIQVAEVSVAAGLSGYANARYGRAGQPAKVVGVDADLAVGVGLHLAGFLGMAGKYGEHCHNLGNGALAAYCYRAGSRMGAKGASTGWAPAGEFGWGTGYAPAGAYDWNAGAAPAAEYDWNQSAGE